MTMTFEQPSEQQLEKQSGAELCFLLKKEKPDALHWGAVDCGNITKEESLIIVDFYKIKENPSHEKIMELNRKVHGLLIRGMGERLGSIFEPLQNELLLLEYEVRHIKNNRKN